MRYDLRFLERILNDEKSFYAEEFDTLSSEVTPLQMALLKRKYCRRESLEEVSKHFRMSETKTEHMLNLALDRISRLYKKALGEEAPTPEPTTPSEAMVNCEYCGTHMKSQSDTVCVRCIRDQIREHTMFTCTPTKIWRDNDV